MAFALVNPISALWQRRGLTSLLMPDGYNAFAAPQDSARVLSGGGPRVQATQTHAGQPHPGQAQAGVAQTSSPRGRQPWQQSRQQGAVEDQAPANQNLTSPTRQQTASRTAPYSAADAASHAAEHAADKDKPAAWLPLPPHVWPSPWQTRLEQTRPGPVLWTYWNLGPDLCEPQTPGRLERRQFLQRLLQDLGHPAGTHTFWPSCLPPDPAALPLPPSGAATDPQGQNAYVANPDVFWSGAMQLKARGVVVMGSAAARAVALPAGLRPPQQIRHRGKLVWVLWDVDNLLQFDQRYASMLALLRDALRHFLR